MSFEGVVTESVYDNTPTGSGRLAEPRCFTGLGLSQFAATVDEKITHAYDQNDRLLTEELDSDNDGTVDQTTTYTRSATQLPANTVTDSASSVTSVANYSHNFQGRLSQAQIDSDGDGTTDTTVDYEYNDRGIRICKTLDGTETLYLVEANNPTGYAQILEEKQDLNADGTIEHGEVLKSYTLGLDVISQWEEANGNLILLYDAHGSTRGMVDALGYSLTAQIHRYDAYGNPIGFDPAAALTTLLYSGEQLDPRIGLQYLRARYYDLSTGRFTRLDPFLGNLTDLLSLDKYLYVQADAANFVDPGGKPISMVMASFFSMKLRGRYIMAGAIGGLAAAWRFGAIRNPLITWDKADVLNHLDEMRLPFDATEADRAIARESLERLIDTVETTPADVDLSNGRACLDFCERVLEAWKSEARDYVNEAESRKKVVGTHRIVWRTNDSLAWWPINDHSAIRLEFSDGKVIDLDNGWLGTCYGSWGKRVFGRSNVPFHYSLGERSTRDLDRAPYWPGCHVWPGTSRPRRSCVGTPKTERTTGKERAEVSLRTCSGGEI
ncbi:MAG TPA: RHS repeat-associated core domain-containing protein [Planctomycetes bacterium]|nr:RHS repeat-associated core domain-containing protein [Planctomycetota bacterium]